MKLTDQILRRGRLSTSTIAELASGNRTGRGSDDFDVVAGSRLANFYQKGDPTRKAIHKPLALDFLTGEDLMLLSRILSAI